MKIYWECEKCQRIGIVEHGEHMGVMEAIYQLGVSHRKVSPDCRPTLEDIRILDTKGWKAEALAVAIKDGE